MSVLELLPETSGQISEARAGLKQCYPMLLTWPMRATVDLVAKRIQDDIDESLRIGAEDLIDAKNQHCHNSGNPRGNGPTGPPLVPDHRVDRGDRQHRDRYRADDLEDRKRFAPKPRESNAISPKTAE
jgi:hypothetical protein